MEEHLRGHFWAPTEAQAKVAQLQPIRETVWKMTRIPEGAWIGKLYKVLRDYRWTTSYSKHFPLYNEYGRPSGSECLSDQF